MENKANTSAAGRAPDPVLIDLGRQKSKKVKQLRKGDGPLVDDLHAVIDELRENGTIDAGAQPVIVVVERKRKRKRKDWPFGG